METCNARCHHCRRFSAVPAARAPEGLCPHPALRFMPTTNARRRSTLRQSGMHRCPSTEDPSRLAWCSPLSRANDCHRETHCIQIAGDSFRNASQIPHRTDSKSKSHDSAARLCQRGLHLINLIIEFGVPTSFATTRADAGTQSNNPSTSLHRSAHAASFNRMRTCQKGRPRFEVIPTCRADNCTARYVFPLQYFCLTMFQPSSMS